jgi:hypothetical protein
MFSLRGGPYLLILCVTCLGLPAFADTPESDSVDAIAEAEAPSVTVEPKPAAVPAVRTKPAPAPKKMPAQAPEQMAAVTALPAAKSPLTIDARGSSTFHAMENADLRPLDERSDRAIIDSDDRRFFGHSDLWLDVGYQVNPSLKTYTSFKYDVMWRDDQIGRSEGSGGDLNIYSMFMNYQPVDQGATQWGLRLGRQPFSIGGLPRDYMLAGTLDALVLNVDSRFGDLRILAVDFFGGNALPEVGYRFYKDGRSATYNLRGETNTVRSGLVYEFLGKKHSDLPLTVKAYYFYASIGGGPIEASGADVTYGGALGNYRDADYQHMMGTRFNYIHEIKTNHDLTFYGEFAQSTGIDRKPLTERDVTTDGMAYGGGLDYVLGNKKSKRRLRLNAEYYLFEGADHGAVDALEFNRGFVGFKGDRIGGNTLGRYLSWRPSSHVDAYGVVNTPQDQSRAAGTSFVHLSLSLGLDKWGLNTSGWLLMDTGSSFAADTNFQDLVGPPPFGRTMAEFEAQRRLGKVLGVAMDVQVSYQANENLKFLIEYGQFMPDEFYELEVDRLAGENRAMLGGQAEFRVARAGAEVSF